MAKLKRADLVSQFSEIVRQEIANFNEKIAIFNLEIKNLYKEISLNKELIHQQKSAINNEKTESEMVNEKNRSKFDKTEQKIEGYKKETSIAIDKLVLYFTEHVENQLKKYQTSEAAKSSEAKADQKTAVFEKRVTNEFSFISKNFDKFEKIFFELKESLSDKFDHDLELLRNELNEKNKLIQEIHIDKEGLLRELRILKKALFVQDKKIESIFTLLGKPEYAK